jgi:hypothetical protein
MMGNESFGIELARRSPMGDDATYVLNQDGRSGTRLPVCDELTDRYNLEPEKKVGASR